MTREEMKELKGLAASMGLYDDKKPCNRAVILGKAIEELEQEPCEDCISREDALMALTGEWTDSTDELIHRFIRRIKTLPSVKPQPKTEQEPCEDAISRDFIELVVEYPEVCCYPEYKGKPYYSIKFLENGKDIVVGFGTYNPKVLSEYLKEYFILPIQTQSKIGHWIIIDDCEQFIAKCSECGRIEDSRMISKYQYCRHCGAKMGEVKE